MVFVFVECMHVLEQVLDRLPLPLLGKIHGGLYLGRDISLDAYRAEMEHDQ